MKSLAVLSAVSFKREIGVVLFVLAAIIMLPIISIVSVTDVSALADPAVTLFVGPVSTTDTYDFGYCTYWAALRRLQTGHAIPNHWGNANTWGVNAQAMGFVVDHSPSVGTVMQTTAGPLGHVAYVESVDTVGKTWTISEMNFKGWDEVDNRTLPARAALDYYFIH